MTILQFLEAAGINVGKIVAVLTAVRDGGGVQGAPAGELLTMLNSAMSAVDLANVASKIPHQLLNIFTGKIEPKEHPSDGA